jgi:hypothetical protein
MKYAPPRLTWIGNVYKLAGVERPAEQQPQQVKRWTYSRG